MIDNRYLLESSPDLLTFEFDSIGPKGSITKVGADQKVVICKLAGKAGRRKGLIINDSKITALPSFRLKLIF
jgi:hypothetical protein